MLKMRNLQKLNRMFEELHEVVKAKGVLMDIDQLKQAMDFTEYEADRGDIVTFMISKLEVEYELNKYDGLANAIKMIQKEIDAKD